MLGSPEFAVREFGGYQVPEGAGITISVTAPAAVPDVGFDVAPVKRIVFYDEGKRLLQKDTAGSSTGNGLVTMYTKLYEKNEHSTGSFKNKKYAARDANVSLMLHFVRADFEQAFAGSGVTSDGFLSRFTITVDKRNPVTGDWRRVDSAAVARLVGKIHECTKRTQLETTPDANAARLEFLKELRSWEPKHAARLEFHFNQDLLARGIFSADGVIDVDTVRRAAEWTRHQYNTRHACWPIDGSRDKAEMMAATVLRALENPRYVDGLTKRQIARLANVYRPGSGGPVVFNRVFQALLQTDLEILGHTKKRVPVYGLRRS